MRRLAAPLIGGLLTGFVMELLIYSVIGYIAKSIAQHCEFRRGGEDRPLATAAARKA